MTSSSGRDEAGTGLIGSAIGITIFLLFMLFAVQVLIGLYASSIVSAAAFDGAKAVAGADSVDRNAAVAGAEASVRRDLGRLLAMETRAVRNDVHRDILATMERRSQQVWIPVTVATLVPGVIFLAIPFIEALRLFSAS